MTPEELEAFYVFWKIYPRKVGKGAARKAWEKALTKQPADKIIAALERFKFDEDPRFRPHPTTWLNGERWEDEQIDLAADPWGVRAWHAAQVIPEGAMFCAAGFDVSAFEEILEAIGLPREWRGDLDTMGKWILDGYRWDSIRDVILQANPAVPSRLIYLDGLVRRRAYHWCNIIHGWRREQR